MSDDSRALIHQIRKSLRSSRAGGANLSQYRDDPGGYFRDVLGTPLIPQLEEVARSLLTPPYRASVDSGHGVGKTYAAAAIANWWYDTRNPCWIITTAPTDRDVKDLLWTEVRLQRLRAKVRLANNLMPRAPEMRSGPEHVAKGYTARDANSAQGRHRTNMLFVFDEKEGVGRQFWDGAKSMHRPGSGDAWLVIGNPLTTTSVAYQEHRAVDAEGNPTWHRFRLSSLDHPNIAAGLRGEPASIPGAVTVGQVDQWVQDWCDPVAAGDAKPTDLEWRGKLYRPGPIGEARILGLRPSQSTLGIWSAALWAVATGPEPPIQPQSLPVIGCDVASYGTDYTAYHARCGPVSLHHRAVNGWDVLQICDYLKQLCEQYAEWWNAGREDNIEAITVQQIAVHIDDDATGRACQTLLTRQGYRVVALNAAGTPQRPDLYANVRSELWFMTAKKAALSLMNVSRLDRATKQRIELQLMAPMWWPDAAGRRVIESKDDLRDPKRMGRSPDDADAMNLAYYEPGALTGVAVPMTQVHIPLAKREQREKTRRLYGR